jgi:lipoprotein signal peptidase
MFFVQNCKYPLSSFLSPIQFSLIGIFFLFSFVILYARFFKRDRMVNLALLSLFLGGLINLLSRIVTGCVTDYLNFFDIFMFNIPDVMISIGIIYLVYRSLYERK